MEYICNDCPRKCNAFRSESSNSGFCGGYSLPSVVRAAPHYGEEPCISGTEGSGAVFFSGCNLKCVFCQNCEISGSADTGKLVSVEELRGILLRLRDTGVHNINLVTPTHFTRVIAQALSGLELGIPVVWNSSGYESVESLAMLDGLVDIYMPDFKYFKKEPAVRYSKAGDYPEVAAKAVKEMYRQVGSYKLDENGLLKRGVLIRHLVLPGQELNAMDVIDFVAEEFPADGVLFSLMSQYTPVTEKGLFPELDTTISSETNSNLVEYMLKRGISSGYWQDGSSATKDMIPAFDGTGV